MKFVSPLWLVALFLTCCTAANAGPNLNTAAGRAAAALGQCSTLPRMKGEAPLARKAYGVPITVPVLNSRPNAKAVIYLDFDGETVTDPVWNNGQTIVAPAFDLTTVQITAIFDRVKEDFWPFAINITTDVTLYNKTAAGKRMRVIMTPNDAAAPGAGGVAILHSFAQAGKNGLTATVPCWVFNQSVIGISEAISHEVGHTMGLLHDGREIPNTGHEEYYLGHGTGVTSWCPIMGASYYVNVSQWSKGEYQDANNFEDDVAIIAGPENGFGYAADEAGNTLATAAPLTLNSNGGIAQVGLIANAADTDFFGFTTSGGTIDVTATGALVAPNLDVAMKILDSTGAVVATDSPDASLDARITKDLTPGKYYLVISGSGAPAPPATGYTTYGSIGAYGITGTFPVKVVTPDMTINDASVNEGNSGQSFVIFTVSLSTSPSNPVTVQYATVPGTATGGNVDYVNATGTLTIRPGQTSGTITVPVIGDLLAEGDETFSVNLTNPSGAKIIDGSGLGTILDDDVPQLSIDDIQVTEGNTGAVTPVKFTVSLTYASANPVTVKYATGDITATAGQDYTATAGTVTIPANALSAKFTVNVLGDTLDESNETFGVQLSQATGASIARPTGACTILDDDGGVTVSVDDVTVTEGNLGLTPMAFTLRLSGVSGQAVSVHVNTAIAPNFPATPKTDFAQIVGQTVTFAPGEVVKTVTVQIKGDTVRENSERLRLILSEPVNVKIIDGIGVGTITDDDTDPTISILPTSVTEGNSGTVKAIFTVQLTAASFQDVTVTCTTADGDAKAGADYIAKSATLTIPAGQTSGTFGVFVNGDILDENDEIFYVNLSNPTGAVLSATNQDASGTILDDDPKPSATLSDASIMETDSGTVNLKFKVQLSTVSGRDVKFTYDTFSGSAVAGTDFTTLSGTLVIPEGQTSANFVVPVIGDTEVESNEQLYLGITQAIGANLDRTLAIGTIVDNDLKAELSIGDTTVREQDDIPNITQFTVTLSKPLNRTVSFLAQTATSTNDPATPDVDFVSFAKTYYIPAGQTSVIVSTNCLGDTLYEADEHFRVVISGATDATIADNIGVATILDNDSDKKPTLNSADAFDTYVTEGDSGTKNVLVDVQLSAVSGKPVTFTYVTANGNGFFDEPAIAGEDYVATSGSITIPAGALSTQIKIPIIGDLKSENIEDFGVGIKSVDGAILGNAFSYCTILDNDPRPTVSISNVTQDEGNTFSKAFNFIVTLSAASGETVTVDAATNIANKFPATAGVDYQALSTTVTFQPGEISKIVSVMVNGDTKAEDDERFQVVLSNPEGCLIGTGVGVGVIVDDDNSAKRF